jgi:hypothetical protein
LQERRAAPRQEALRLEQEAEEPERMATRLEPEATAVLHRS